jgi:hypothetical protein
LAGVRFAALQGVRVRHLKYVNMVGIMPGNDIIAKIDLPDVEVEGAAGLGEATIETKSQLHEIICGM